MPVPNGLDDSTNEVPFILPAEHEIPEEIEPIDYASVLAELNEIDPFDEEELEANENKTSSFHLQSTIMDHLRHPNLQCIHSAVLSDGPRARKEAKYLVVLDHKTGEVNHDRLTIETFRKLKGEWNPDEKFSVALTSKGNDEIENLIAFLNMARGGSLPTESGPYIAHPLKVAFGSKKAAEDDKSALLRSLESLTTEGQSEVLAEVLQRAVQSPELFTTLLERAARDPQLFAEAAAALNLATYKRAVADLRSLVESKDRVLEARFQQLLSEHPWMFGSEYSHRYTRSRLTRDELQDHVLRRTIDNYIEIIEIKTPLEGAELFRCDSSHKSYYASPDLSRVVGQVQNYIEIIDAERDSILVKDGEDTTKIRAKIIIGRDRDENQQKALRRFNGHSHRIEVITFDGLLRIAGNVLSYLENAFRPSAD